MRNTGLAFPLPLPHLHPFLVFFLVSILTFCSSFVLHAVYVSSFISSRTQRLVFIFFVDIGRPCPRFPFRVFFLHLNLIIFLLSNRVFKYSCTGIIRNRNMHGRGQAVTVGSLLQVVLVPAVACAPRTTRLEDERVEEL